LAGGGTGLIGDPSFKATERPILSDEEIANNIAGIRSQLNRFLDFEPSKSDTTALLLDNATWLRPLVLTDFLRDVGKHFTVNQMIAKESVKSRLERADVGITFTEFSYMLLQSYDFHELYRRHGCTLQIGGSDQWGNITMGAELIRKLDGASADGLTSPLLLRADGTKFGKSESGGNVWLDATMTSPFAMHQFFLNSDDAMTPQLLRYFTFLSHDEIRSLDERLSTAPQERMAQRVLANEVVTMVHGEEAAKAAERAGEALFGESIRNLDEQMLLEVVADAPSSTFPRSELVAGIAGADLLVRCELAKSLSEARRFLDQGGVYVNNVRLEADATVNATFLLHERYLVVRRGRRSLHLVVVG
jgi:tyrosyl-tRNA synthetase